MSAQWYSEDIPPEPRPRALSWTLFGLRMTILALVTLVCLALHVLVRLVERPLHGLRRPWSPLLQQFVGRSFLAVSGLRLKVRGRPMSGRGALVSNHVSWSDIWALSAPQPVCFVAKAEVRDWPAIGLLARAAGTVFIRRDRREAGAQQLVLREQLLAGQRLLFFPEGTSTDGMRVLPFKPTLFGAFFDEALRDVLQVQPVTLIYRAPEGAEPRFYGWWGDMDFLSHLVKVIGAPRQGTVEIVYHPPLRVADFADRKALARECERAVRAGMPAEFR